MATFSRWTIDYNTKKNSTQIHNYIIQSQHDQWSIAVAVAIEQLLIQQ